MHEPENSEKEPKEVTFGGGKARMIYEGKYPDPNKSFLFVIAGAVIAILLVFAAIGIFSLIKGSFSEVEEDPSGAKYVVKVPTVSELTPELTPSEMTAMLRDFAVTVKAVRQDGTALFASGFFITSNGYLVTSSALFTDKNPVSVSVFYGNYGELSAVVCGTDESIGITVLQISKGLGIASMLEIPFGNPSSVKAADDIWCVPSDFPGVFQGFVQKCFVSSVSSQTVIENKDGTKTVFNPIFADRSFNSSLDGAMLVNSSGKIIGVCLTSPEKCKDGLGFAVPINTVIDFLNQIIK